MATIRSAQDIYCTTVKWLRVVTTGGATHRAHEKQMSHILLLSKNIKSSGDTVTSQLRTGAGIRM